MELTLVQAFFDPFTIGIGIATSAFGLFTSNSASRSQARAERNYERQANSIYSQEAQVGSEISDITQKNEAIRQQQAELDYRRARREVIRKAQLARSVSLSRGASQGAQDSSGVSGGLSQIANELSNNLTALDQNFDLGQQTFSNNRDILGLQNRQAQLQTNLNKLNTSFKRESSVNTNRQNLGNTLFSTGSNIVSNYETIGKVGRTLFQVGG